MFGYVLGKDIAATRHRTEGTSRRGFRGSHPRFPDGGRQTNPGCVNAFDLVGFQRGEQLAVTSSLSLSLVSDVSVSRNSSPLFFADTHRHGAFALSGFTFAFRILIYLTPTGK